MQQYVVYHTIACPGANVNGVPVDGDGLLVEEWSYPSALHTSRPHGVVPVPVAMDLEGMRSDALETILRTWDESARGCRR